MGEFIDGKDDQEVKLLTDQHVVDAHLKNSEDRLYGQCKEPTKLFGFNLQQCMLSDGYFPPKSSARNLLTNVQSLDDDYLDLENQLLQKKDNQDQQATSQINKLQNPEEDRQGIQPAKVENPIVNQDLSIQQQAHQTYYHLLEEAPNNFDFLDSLYKHKNIDSELAWLIKEQKIVQKQSRQCMASLKGNIKKVLKKEQQIQSKLESKQDSATLVRYFCDSLIRLEMTQLSESVVKVLARRRKNLNKVKVSEQEVITEPYLFSTMKIDQEQETNDNLQFEYLLQFDPIFNLDNTWVTEHTLNCFNKLRQSLLTRYHSDNSSFKIDTSQIEKFDQTDQEISDDIPKKQLFRGYNMESLVFCHHCKQLKQEQIHGKCQYDSTKHVNLTPLSSHVNGVKVYNIEPQNSRSVNCLIAKKIIKDQKRRQQLVDMTRYTCSNYFCSFCLSSFYDVELTNARSNPNWICPFCTGVCFCSRCRRQEQLTSVRANLLSHNSKKYLEQAYSTIVEDHQPFPDKNVQGSNNVFDRIIRTNLQKIISCSELITTPDDVASPSLSTCPGFQRKQLITNSMVSTITVQNYLLREPTKVLYADKLDSCLTNSSNNSLLKKRTAGLTEVTKRFNDALHEFINRERSSCFEFEDQIQQELDIQGIKIHDSDEESEAKDDASITSEVSKIAVSEQHSALDSQNQKELVLKQFEEEKEAAPLPPEDFGGKIIAGPIIKKRVEKSARKSLETKVINAQLQVTINAHSEQQSEHKSSDCHNFAVDTNLEENKEDDHESEQDLGKKMNAQKTSAPMSLQTLNGQEKKDLQQQTKPLVPQQQQVHQQATNQKVSKITLNNKRNYREVIKEREGSTGPTSPSSSSVFLLKANANGNKTTN